MGNIHTVGSNFLFQSEKDEAGGSLANVTSTASPSPSMNKSSVNGNGVHIAGNGQPESGDRCAGCSGLLRDGQALVALDKQYHIWCFKCTACQVSCDWLLPELSLVNTQLSLVNSQVLLHGEYMGHEGRPYCERCYHEKFGVRCTYCHRSVRK